MTGGRKLARHVFGTCTRPVTVSHHLLTEAVDRALAGERDQGHVAGLPRLEAHRVPAAMSSRVPRAFLRSNFSAGLVSKK